MPIQIVYPTPDLPVQLIEGYFPAWVVADPTIVDVVATCSPAEHPQFVLAGQRRDIIFAGDQFLWLFLFWVPGSLRAGLQGAKDEGEGREGGKDRRADQAEDRAAGPWFRIDVEWLSKEGRRGVVCSLFRLEAPIHQNLQITFPAPDTDITPWENYLCCRGTANAGAITTAVLIDTHGTKSYPVGGTKMLPGSWSATFTGLTHSGSPYDLHVTDTQANHEDSPNLMVD